MKVNENRLGYSHTREELKAWYRQTQNPFTLPSYHADTTLIASQRGLWQIIGANNMVRDENAMGNN